MQVEFKDENRTIIIAQGFFGDENVATSAIDRFLENIEDGEDFGREANGSYEEENDTFYFRVTDYS